MDQRYQNLQEQDNISQKLIKHIENKQLIKQMYKDKGIQMLDKQELLFSDIQEKDLKPDQQNTYNTMKRELSKFEYSEFRYLGQGAQGLVVLAKENETNKRYAIKGIHIKDSQGKIDQKSVNQAKKEISILNQCKGSPYVVNFIGEIEGKEYIYLVLTECLGTLREIIETQQDKKLNELSAIKYAKDIAEGLFFIHSKNCLLNDLKMDNILIDYNGNAVVSDFGLSDQLTKQSEYSMNLYYGNAAFQAPECIDPKQFEDYFVEYQKLNVVVKTQPSQRSEAFSLGYLFYTMISGFNYKLLVEKHKPVTYKPEFQNFVYKKQLEYIINGLTQFIPRSRLEIKEALIILKGIISFEFQLESKFVELIDIEDSIDYQVIHSYKKSIELVEGYQNKFYPIIKNEKQLINQLNQKVLAQKQKQDQVREDLNKKIESLEKTIKSLLNDKEQNQNSQQNIYPFFQQQQQANSNQVLNQQGYMIPQQNQQKYNQVFSKEETTKAENYQKIGQREKIDQYQKNKIQPNIVQQQNIQQVFIKEEVIESENIQKKGHKEKIPKYQKNERQQQIVQNQNNQPEKKKGYLYRNDNNNFYVTDEKKNWIGLIKIKEENNYLKDMKITFKGKHIGTVSYMNGKKQYIKQSGITEDDFSKSMTEQNCEYLLF